MWNSSIGIKILVAASGVLLLLFVVGHLAGNLQIFLGQDVFNDYAVKLRAFPAALLLFRAGIAVVALVHIVATLRLAILNKRARPVAYRAKESVAASLGSRTMVLSGLLLLAFVVYHLAHFTWQVTNPQYQVLVDGQGRHDVYTMVILGFRNYLIAGSYIVAMILLGFHLSHGIASVFQTLGWLTPNNKAVIERVARLVTVILVAGYISIPLLILLGVVRPLSGGI